MLGFFRANPVAEQFLLAIESGSAFFSLLNSTVPGIISDVDSDPVGSAFIWVPGSGSGSRD